MRDEIVAAALEKFGGEGGGPVGSVGFEGVGEDGVGRGVAEGFDEGFADGFQVGGYGVVGEGIEDPAFGSYGGALDYLAGVAGDEDEGGSRLPTGGKGCIALVKGLGGGGVPVFGFAVDDGDRDDDIAIGELGSGAGGGGGDDIAIGELGVGEGGGAGGDGDLKDA